MSGTSLLVGGLDAGANVNSSRKRVFGMLGRGPRGLTLTMDDNDFWIIDTDDDVARFLGRRVIVEGAVAGLDRLKAEWIGDGKSPTESGWGSLDPKRRLTMTTHNCPARNFDSGIK